MLIQLCLSAGIAIIVSAFCSIMEAVLYSIPDSQIEVLVQSGKLSGTVLKKLKATIHKPITAILTLNTIANTMGAAVAGASAAVVFGDENLGWFSAIFTLTILLFSEILPKTAGVAYARGLAPWIALPLYWLVKILSPAIWVCQAVTHLIPAHARAETLVSIKEVQAIATLGRKTGVIDPQQEKVITNILDLNAQSVRQVMTPRTVTCTLSEHLPVIEAMEQKQEWNRHSRIPIYDKDPDDIVGIVLTRDILLSAADEKGHRTLAALMKPVHFVPESAPLNRVLLDFFEYHQHLFVVVDEYGGVTGVITLEDIIEEIVGREIVDEFDQAKDMRELARRKKKMLAAQRGST